MTTDKIVNAAPQSIMLGIKDNSTRQLPIEAEVLPSHLAKVLHFAKWGPTDDQLVGGAGFNQTYHADSLDHRKAWATHASESLVDIFGAGSVAITRRVVPHDAAKPASIRLWADVLPFSRNVYLRNTDGSFKKDGQGNYLTGSGTVNGFRVKFVAEEIANAEDGTDTFGLATIQAGDQTDPVSHTQSQRIPLTDVEVPHQGAHGRNMGLRMWAPTSLSATPLNEDILTTEKCYPIRMACLTRADETSTGTIASTTDGEQYLELVLKPNVYSETLGQELYVGDRFIQAYQDLNTEGFVPTWGPFGKIHLYDANIATLLAELAAAEKAQMDSFSDFTSASDSDFLFNLFGGQSSSGAPYQAYEIVTGTDNSVRLSEGSVIYAFGGSDGTMNNQVLADLVSEHMAEYADQNSEFTSMALHPEKEIYDTGFPLETKYDLLQFIALRKDTFVGLCTYTVGGPKLTASAESALAVLLRTRALNYPDSEYFGTPVVRAALFSRHGTKLGTQFKGDLPLIMEFIAKAAKYMGAGDGIWKSVYNFDSGDLAQVQMFTNINVAFTPQEVRNKDWANGLNWVEAFQRKTTRFPAFKTVYPDDTSVLTSIFTAMICGQVQAIGDRVRMENSGTSKLTGGELTDKINKRILELTDGKFDGRVTIVPKAYITKADAARGFSWTCPIGVYADNMKTVGVISVESYRSEDLVQ